MAPLPLCFALFACITRAVAGGSVPDSVVERAAVVTANGMEEEEYFSGGVRRTHASSRARRTYTTEGASSEIQTASVDNDQHRQEPAGVGLKSRSVDSQRQMNSVEEVMAMLWLKVVPTHEGVVMTAGIVAFAFGFVMVCVLATLAAFAIGAGGDLHFADASLILKLFDRTVGSYGSYGASDQKTEARPSPGMSPYALASKNGSGNASDELRQKMQKARDQYGAVSEYDFEQISDKVSPSTSTFNAQLNIQRRALGSCPGAFTQNSDKRDEGGVNGVGQSPTEPQQPEESSRDERTKKGKGALMRKLSSMFGRG